MYLSVIIDATALAVLIWFARTGWKRGVVRTLSELIVVVLAMILAGKIADIAARQAVEYMRPAAYQAVEEQVDQLLAEGDVYAAPEEIISKLLEVVDGLPDILQGHAKDVVEGLALSPAQVTHSARETLVRLGSQAADAALNGAVYRTAHALFYTLAFSVAAFLLRRVARALLVLRKLPVLKQTDQALGLAAGLAKGALLVWLAAWIIPFLVEVPPQVRDGSFLLRHTMFVKQGPLMAKLFSLPGIGG